MKLEKKDLIYTGKAKSLYQTDQAQYLITEFRDDTTAFDGAKHEQLAEKGVTNTRISNHIMQVLEQAGVPTHFVESLSNNEIIVRRLEMIPLESVIRNVAAGSLCRRLGIEERMELDPPLWELFLKNDELHDPIVNQFHALNFGWATQAQLDEMHALTLKINSVLRELFAKGGMILVDAKFEFGMADGKMYLGDEISPDSCRIWDEETLEPLDKDRFRKDLGGVVDAYQQIAKRLEI